MYSALKGAPNSNCIVQVLCFQSSPNSKCNVHVLDFQNGRQQQLQRVGSLLSKGITTATVMRK